MDVNYFNILSNEVTSSIISFLDATSFFQFCRCSQALFEFNNITNEHWRIFYSIQWCVDDGELVIYSEEDWQTVFKRRFNAEKSFTQRIEQKLPVTGPYGNSSYKTTPISSLDPIEESLGKLLTLDPTRLLAGRISHPLALYMDSQTKIDLEVDPLEVTVTAIAKILRLDPEKWIQDPVNAGELFACLDVLDNYIRNVNSRPCLGLVSVLRDYIGAKFQPKSIRAAAVIFTNILILSNNEDDPPDYRAMADNLHLVRRTVEVFEKVTSDPWLDVSLLSTLRHLLKKSCKDSAELVRRPAFIKRLKEVIQNKKPELSPKTANGLLTNGAAVVSNIASIDPDYAASQGLLEVLIDVAYQIEGVDKWLLFDVAQGLKRFSNSKNLRLKIASNTSLLNHIMRLLHSAAKSGEVPLSDLRMVFLLFRELCRKSLSTMFDGGYLEELLPYLKKVLTDTLFADLCDIMGYFIRHGIENLRLDVVHKKLEPHLQTIINHRHFKESIPFWQNYYCGMPMPREITKSLVERIIPEVPLETDLDYARSYAELLANIAQSDRAVLLEMDIQVVFEHFALKLILDEDRENDTNSRGLIPYPICFLSASASLPQAAQLAIHNSALLDKMNSLYCDEEENETIYMVTHFYSHLVTLQGWDNRKGLDILARFGATMPLDADMYFMFTFIEPYSHLFLRDNPVEMVLFGSWMVARMSQRKEGRLGLKKLSADVVEWLSGHSDMRIRKNMNHYHQNMENAKNLYDIEV